jgi:hypothetical protein
LEFLSFVAIRGTSHYFGTGFLKPGQIVHLRKDPDNPYDQEAIRVEIPSAKSVLSLIVRTRCPKDAEALAVSMIHSISGIVMSSKIRSLWNLRLILRKYI